MMKFPKKVLIIGTADFIRFTALKKNRPSDRTLSNYILAVNQSHTILYLFPNNTTGATKSIEDKSGMQRGHIHTAIQYRIPTAELKKVGTISSIQYSSDWWEGSLNKYEHLFDESPNLYADKYSRFRVMAIKPKSGRILTEEGIEG